MVGELIMLPLRVGVRATRLWLRVAEETASVAANATGRLIGMAATRGSGNHGATGAELPVQPRSERMPAEPHVESEPRGERLPSPSVTDRGDGSTTRPRPSTPVAPPERDTPPEPPHVAAQPAHVSEEPTVVEELAEPGAEDGAGAEVRVDEPWKDYAHMNAKQITARLNAATPAELAAVQLYERSHRRRQTILNAVQRELRSANGRGSTTQEERGSTDA